MQPIAYLLPICTTHSHGSQGSDPTRLTPPGFEQQAELHAYDERLRRYADKKIALDLDDSVKVNYGKFGDLLAEVKSVTGARDEE